MLKYLDQHGYAVVAGAADASALESGKDSFWSFWEKEKFKGALDRNDMHTWKNWMANVATGILISSRAANHNDFLWGARTLPIVKKTFSKIWGDDNLIVSYDAGGVFRPWKYNIQWLTNGGWWHVDQNHTKGPHRQGRVTVQGLVTYYDATPETGGLCVIPGSHLSHQEVCERAPSAKIKVDYVAIPAGDPILRSQEPVLVCAKAGDLILWDSRTVHCNTPALHMGDYFNKLLEKSTTPSTDPAHAQAQLVQPFVEESMEGQPAELLRLVAYVCMVPASHASQELLHQRKQAFLHKLPTSHYPTYEIAFFPKEWVAPWTTRREVLELVGFSDWEIADMQAGRNPNVGQWTLFDGAALVVGLLAILYFLLW
jgi:ectoine hydroxylase-related dioxygenase (phytanoyl-CoA dioxygenase family)